MSRLQKLFSEKKQPVLNVYCTAGFPERDSTMKVIAALEKSGADIVELGMPYSDPLADGPVIQRSSHTALENGMTIQLLFEQLEGLRSQTKIPVLLMGYMNPVLQFGFERFCEEAARVGVDGLILPDLPQYEFESHYGPIIKKHGLDFIFLVTPETSDERVKKLDQLSSGFLYAVSSSSTTGTDQSQNDVTGYLRRLQSLNLTNPVLVGFGIKDKETFQSAAAYSRGAIIGTAFIKALSNAGDVEKTTQSFLQTILA
jgi:tryptophan synthase alpha chain